MELQEQIQEVQAAFCINRQLQTVAKDFELFKFLVGDQSKDCKFDRFLHLWHSSEGDLASAINAFLHQNDLGNTRLAVQAARNLFALEEILAKSEFLDGEAKYVAGNNHLFDQFAKNYNSSEKTLLANPGRHSSEAHIIAFSSAKMFVKPVKDIERGLHEVKAYDVAKKMGLEEYLLKSCLVSIKGKEKPKAAVVTEILPYDAIPLEQFMKEKPEKADAFLQKMIDNGDAHKLALFDYIIDNSDAHRNNLFYYNNKLISIDHTEAFRKRDVGFIPGYLRKSDFKKTNKLPIASEKGDENIKNWLFNLKIEDKSVIHHLLEAKSPSVAINRLWEEYYPENSEPQK